MAARVLPRTMRPSGAPRRGAPGLCVAHGDRRADARAKAARRHLADHRAVRVDDFGAFARRRAALDFQPDPAARRSLSQLPPDHRVAGKAALLAPSLRNGPCQSGLDGRRALVDVVAVEAKARLQTKGIAGPEADRLDLGFGEQALGERRRLVVRQRNLEPVLAGVAGAREIQAVAETPVAFGRAEGHERLARDRGEGAGQHRRRLRPLQGEQRAVVDRLEPQVGQGAANMREIGALARRVDHQEQAILAWPARRAAHHHQIVENPAVFIEQLGVAYASRRLRGDVGRRQRFESPGGVGSFQIGLTHVRDVEQAGGGAGVQVFGQNAGRKLHRHVVAGERNHARAQLHMQRVKRRAQQIGRDRRIG